MASAPRATQDDAPHVAPSEPSPEDAPAPAPPRAARDDEDDAPLDASADTEASRRAPWWDAGGLGLSGAYWGSLGIIIAGLFRATLLPFVDYPQHLALAATLRRMIAGDGPERALFETNLASYNSLFHLVVALLNFVVPIDAAGKLVLSAYVLLVGYATLALLRATGRPRARAFLVLPVVMGYSIAWGFVNFGLGVAVQLIVLARILERGHLSARVVAVRDPRRWWHRVVYGSPTAAKPWTYDAVTAALAIVGAYTHLMATALLYMLMLVAIIVRVQTERAPLLERFGRALRTGLPLLPAIFYSAWVYRRQESAAFKNYEYARWEGNDGPALDKLKSFDGYATGLRTDALDAKVLMIGLGLLLIGALLRDPDDDPPPVARWLFLVSLLAYLVIPHVFWATNFVFERISFLVVVTAVVWAPRALPSYEEWLRLFYVAIGVAAAACFFTEMGTARDEMADLDRVLDEAPKGRRVTGLVFDPHLPSTSQPSLLHSTAFYVARDGGEVAFSFTRTMSLPVHYRRETMPPDVPANFEWNPQTYDPNAAYARYFDLVLMKVTNDDGIDPRESVWGRHASEVDLVTHHGRWWVFETKRVTPDPWSPLGDDEATPGEEPQ